MSKPKPKLPKRVSSTFAIVEIKRGREAVRKIVEASYHSIPFTIRGTIDPGKGGIGPSDNVGTEFSTTVTSIKLHKPIRRPSDKFGRPYALAKNMKPGVVLECDDGFTCIRSGAKRTVLRRAGRLKGVTKEYAKDPFARLYIDCKCGGHSLDGQLGDHGELIGLYKVKAA